MINAYAYWQGQQSKLDFLIMLHVLENLHVLSRRNYCTELRSHYTKGLKILISKHLVYRWTGLQMYWPTFRLIDEISMLLNCTVYIEMFSNNVEHTAKIKYYLRENEYLKLQRLLFIYKLNMSFTCNFNIKLVTV